MTDAAVTAGLLALAMGLIEVIKAFASKKPEVVTERGCAKEHSELSKQIELFAQRSDIWHKTHADILNRQIELLERLHDKAA